MEGCLEARVFPAAEQRAPKLMDAIDLGISDFPVLVKSISAKVNYNPVHVLIKRHHKPFWDVKLRSTVYRFEDKAYFTQIRTVAWNA